MPWVARRHIEVWHGNGDCQHQFPRGLVTADQLDNNIDFRIVDHGKGIVADRDRLDTGQACRVIVACCRLGDFDAPAGAPGNLQRISPQYIKGTATDRTQPQ